MYSCSIFFIIPIIVFVKLFPILKAQNGGASRLMTMALKVIALHEILSNLRISILIMPLQYKSMV